jgi:5'-phosphate synthase pdxT subunit
MKIGVLALQGDFLKHEQVLSNLGLHSTRVRYESDLSSIDGLIIPGGESTTMTKLLERKNLFYSLKEFSKTHPIMGTCAGLILMSQSCGDHRIKSLGILDIEVKRNAFGRQIHSFTHQIELAALNRTIYGTFIRAPKITYLGLKVEVIATFKKEPVAIRNGIHLGLTFHPELNDEPFFHKLAFSRMSTFSSSSQQAVTHAS